MKKLSFLFGVMLLTFFSSGISAQCSICTKTASQMGRQSGMGINTGILYLMAIPFIIAGFIFYQWYKANRQD